MRTVSHDGHEYLLLKQSGESSLVRDPDTGEQRYLPNADLEPVEGTSPLVTAAGAVPASVRRVLAATPSDRALGLLLEIDRRGPVTPRELLEGYDLCESDILGLVGEFRAAGLVEQREPDTELGGARAYDTTDLGGEGLALLRSL
jgi:hypothetical protein